MRVIAFAVIFLAISVAGACSDGDQGDKQNSPSPRSTSSSPQDVPGFSVELLFARQQRVVLDPMPDVAEPIEGGERLPTSSSPEGEIPSIAFFEQFGPDFPLITSRLRPMGNWLPTGIRDTSGEIVAVRLESEAPDGVDIPLFTFDAVAEGATQNARVLGPTEAYEDSVDGVRRYPPLEVLVRGQTGFYLHQELRDGEPLPPGTPICTLVWLESGVYYRMSGICDVQESRFDMFLLIEAANGIQPYQSN